MQDLMDLDQENVWDVVGRRGGWIYISGCVMILFSRQTSLVVLPSIMLISFGLFVGGIVWRVWRAIYDEQVLE